MWWFFFTPSGKIARRRHARAKDLPQPLDAAFKGGYDWLTNVFRDTSDELWFAAFLFVVLLSLGLSQGDRSRARWQARGARRPAARLLHPLLHDGPVRRGSVWLVSQRFPVLFLLTLVPILRFPARVRGAFITVAAAALVAVGST